MRQDTGKQSIFCTCTEQDHTHHPYCCLRCRYCNRKVKRAFIDIHEAQCEARRLTILGKVIQDEHS